MSERPGGDAPEARAAWLARLAAIAPAGVASLARDTAEGLRIEVLHDGAIPVPVPLRKDAGRPWTIMQQVQHPDAATANAQALEDLSGGATGLALAFAGAVSARGFGLASADARVLAAALRDVELHAIALRIEAGRRGVEAARSIAALVAARSLNPERLDLSFAIDPVGVVASEGGPPFEGLSPLAWELAREFKGPFAHADGRPFHEGGAGESQELGAALASGVCHLRALASGLDGEALAGSVGMTLAADADLFLGIAKFRAARVLWRQVLAECGLPETPLNLHAETSWRMMTRRDPHTNMLRAVSAVAAAGLGGADSISVVPFTAVHGLPDPFARRMARNVQNVLLCESELHRVADPAAGSASIEATTGALAARAWTFFRDIERRGGILEALKSGAVQSEIARTAAERRRRIAEGRQPVLGTTVYAGEDLVFPSVLAGAPTAVARRNGGIPSVRDAEPFELDRGA